MSRNRLTIFFKPSVALLGLLFLTGCEDPAASKTNEDLGHLVLTLCEGPPIILAKSNIEHTVDRFDYDQKKIRKSKTDWIHKNCEFLLYANAGATSALKNISENGIFFGFVDHLLISENADFEAARGGSNPLGSAILNNTIPFSDSDMSISFEAVEARAWIDVEPGDFQWKYLVSEFRSGKVDAELLRQHEDESGARSLVIGQVTHGSDSGKSVILIKLTSEWSQ